MLQQVIYFMYVFKGVLLCLLVLLSSWQEIFVLLFSELTSCFKLLYRRSRNIFPIMWIYEYILIKFNIIKIKSTVLYTTCFNFSLAKKEGKKMKKI